MTNNYIKRKNNHTCSYCLKCNKAYYTDRAKYDKEKHRFICPNCGK